jgi:hypothetical protein
MGEVRPELDAASTVHVRSGPPSGNNNGSHASTLLRLLIALFLVYYFHLSSIPSLPRLQPIAYPVEEGDIVYGLRVIVPLPSRGRGPPRKWMVEVGKVPDDNLKSRVIDQYVGLSDNWWYFKVETPEETHFLLASLFLVSSLLLAHRSSSF